MTAQDFCLENQMVERVPVRRFFARLLDFLLYSDAWSVFLIAVCNVNPGLRSNFGRIIDIAVPILCMLLIEPILLCRFGATPGKWILGLEVRYADGRCQRRLTYIEALIRTWIVLKKGMGFDLPLYNIYRMWRSRSACRKGEPLPWEEESRVFLKDRRKLRSAAYIAVNLLLIGIVAAAVIRGQLPKYRGDITVAQFCENYNQLSDYYLGNSRHYLKEDATWVRTDQQDTGYAFLLGEANNKRPEFVFEERDGIMTGMSFVCIVKSDRIGGVPQYISQRFLSVTALAGTQKNYFSYAKDLQAVVSQITDRPYQSFTDQIGAFKVCCRVEHEGYGTVDDGAALFLEEDRESGTLTIRFSVEKTAP